MRMDDGVGMADRMRVVRGRDEGREVIGLKMKGGRRNGKRRERAGLRYKEGERERGGKMKGGEDGRGKGGDAI